MLVSCILVSHNKASLCSEAIQSVVNQTHQEWECLVVDSGVLYDKGYFDSFPWSADERLIFLRSTETNETRKTKAMAPWCFNECIRKGLVKGELVVFLSDDDLFYPNAFNTFVTYAESHPEALAMYASQDIGVIHPNGWRSIIGERRALGIAGKFANGCPINCVFDYLQFCVRRQVLDRVLWPESKETESHADGVFYEAIGSFTPIHPIDIKVSQNRRTPQSTYVPSK